MYTTFKRLAVLFVFAGIALAQSTGSIRGTITDATGALLPNATVTVSNQATGESHALKTDSTGLYSIPSLPPGAYKVEVAAPGMQTVLANDLVVAVGTTTTQDFSIKVGATSTTIEIQAVSPVVEGSSVSVGTVIDRRTVQEIPLNGRHFVDLALLIPGSVTPPANGFLTAPLRGQGSFAFNSAGAREDEINFMINGIQMSDMAQNQITFQPTINTVEEFKVDNSTYGAEYGRNAGAIVNIATRAGSNEIHGEVYHFLRNAAMDARNFGNPAVTQPQAPFRRNQFGAAGGGPLKKDKTFFFLSYEGLVQRQSVPLTSTVPTAAQRSQVTDPIVQKLLPLIPLPNSGNQFVSSAVAPVNIHQGTANFTQQFSQSNRFNAYYAMQHDQRNEPPTTQGSTLPGSGDSREGWRQLLALNDTHTITPTLVNEARAGFNRIHIVFAAQNTLNAADFGINTGVNAPIGLPQIAIPNATAAVLAFGGINAFPQGRGDDTITLSDTLNWVHGNHSIKFGPEFHHVIADSFTQTPGVFNFPTITAFLNDQANSFTGNASNRAARIRINSIGAFVQDSWKLKRNLTLDLGLRYDWNGTPTEAKNRFVIFDPVSVSLQQVGVSGGPSRAYDQSALNFEPRIGFAWDPSGAGRTVVRSAYAIFVDQPVVGLVNGLYANPPFAQPVNFTTAGTNLNFGNAFNLASGSVAPTSVAHNYKNAYVQSWNFNIQ
jgi:outer membrane receptor protein involved in Fe transport